MSRKDTHFLSSLLSSVLSDQNVALQMQFYLLCHILFYVDCMCCYSLLMFIILILDWCGNGKWKENGNLFAFLVVRFPPLKVSGFLFNGFSVKSQKWHLPVKIILLYKTSKYHKLVFTTQIVFSNNPKSNEKKTNTPAFFKGTRAMLTSQFASSLHQIYSALTTCWLKRW